MDTHEVAQAMGCTPTTVRRRIKRGELRARRIWNRQEAPHYDIPERELALWFKRREVDI